MSETQTTKFRPARDYGQGNVTAIASPRGDVVVVAETEDVLPAWWEGDFQCRPLLLHMSGVWKGTFLAWGVPRPPDPEPFETVKLAFAWLRAATDEWRKTLPSANLPSQKPIVS